ncbi:hypothetical protein RU639_009234 [Aspergillus parasiticus]
MGSLHPENSTGVIDTPSSLALVGPSPSPMDNAARITPITITAASKLKEGRLKSTCLFPELHHPFCKRGVCHGVLDLQPKVLHLTLESVLEQLVWMWIAATIQSVPCLARIAFRSLSGILSKPSLFSRSGSTCV